MKEKYYVIEVKENGRHVICRHWIFGGNTCAYFYNHLKQAQKQKKHLESYCGYEDMFTGKYYPAENYYITTTPITPLEN